MSKKERYEIRKLIKECKKLYYRNRLKQMDIEDLKKELADIREESHIARVMVEYLTGQLVKKKQIDGKEFEFFMKFYLKDLKKDLKKRNNKK